MTDQADVAGYSGPPLELEGLTVAADAVLEGIPDAVVAADRDGRIVFVNALTEELFGYPRAELVGQSVDVLWPERVRELYRSNMERYFEIEHPLRFVAETWGLRRDGIEFVGEMSWGVIETSRGPLLLAVGRDISARRAAEVRVRASATLGERALIVAEPASLAAEALELLRETLPLAGAAIRWSGERSPRAWPFTEPGRIVLPLTTGDQLVIVPTRHLRDDELSHLRAVAHTLSIAFARQRERERMRHESVHDPLTGLANRILLSEQLEHALARSARDGTATGVLFVDLDNFKQVNDAHGHAVGDDVLAAVGARMLSAVRPTDTVARLGGDEFVVVCESIDEQSALELSKRLLEAISAPLFVGGEPYEISASIGIAVGHGDASALLRDADAAGYRAKANGRRRVELYR